MQLADDQHAMKIIHVEGKEHLVSALRKGKGVIAFGAHIGNFVLVRDVVSALAGHGFTQSFESQATNGCQGSLQTFNSRFYARPAIACRKGPC